MKIYLLLFVSLFVSSSSAQTRQEWRDSLETLNANLKKDPANIDLRLRKAEADIQLEQWDYALAEYGRILRADENNLAADHVAAQLGEPIEQVFKTLVLRGDRGGLFVCVMPGDQEVDLKVAAKISGNKSAAMIHMKELLPETGYIRGGCSPIGMKKNLPTFIHESALLYDHIFVSAGIRGLQIKIDPNALISFIGADLYPL